MDKLNLGCGPDYRDGYLNVDQAGKCDKVFDLSYSPWPWEDNTFVEILALDFIEHFYNTIKLMEECHRILVPSGKLIIRTPSYDAPFAWCDPTHVKLFTIKSFDFFDPSTPYGSYNNHLTDKKWKIIKKVKTKNKNLEIEMEKI